MEQRPELKNTLLADYFITPICLNALKPFDPAGTGKDTDAGKVDDHI